MNVDVNYIAILVAGIASMVAGFLWYSPVLFAKPWMKLMGHSSESLKVSQKQMGKLYGFSFILSLLMAYVLYHTMVLSMNFFHYDKLPTGLNTAFWMWLGFVMPVQATTTIFGKGLPGKNEWQLFAINTGYQLVSLLLMGVAIGLLM